MISSKRFESLEKKRKIFLLHVLQKPLNYENLEVDKDSGIMEVLKKDKNVFPEKPIPVVPPKRNMEMKIDLNLIKLDLFTNYQ